MQLEKAKLPIDNTVDGIFTTVSMVHDANAEAIIFGVVRGIVMLPYPLQSEHFEHG